MKTHRIATALILALTVVVAGTTAHAAVFAKYDGVDGESTDANHDKWIDVLSIDWGSNVPGDGATQKSRRRGAVVVEDVTLTIEYEKASPKLLEVCAGQMFPTLIIEETATRKGRQCYLKYELKNVRVTDYSVSGAADDGPAAVVIGNNFEEIKVTYTEYDDANSEPEPATFDLKR
jgi:type VI secretion system secreted protein Hcp